MSTKPIAYSDLLDGLARFGTSPEDACTFTLGVRPNQISETVLIAPWWEPSRFPALGAATRLTDPENVIQVWRVATPSGDVTFIETGVGSPLLMDSVLSLGVTPCKRIVFLGTAGALVPEIGVGDIVVPQYSISGDGASRYLVSDSLAAEDSWGRKAAPDLDLVSRIESVTARVCAELGTAWHRGTVFSVDTIFAQYAHMDEIAQLGCNVIEMETAAAFRAAKLAGIPMAAVFAVSDNTVTKQTLLGERTPAIASYRAHAREVVYPRIIVELLAELIGFES